ncbi:acyl-CoA thioesterase/BAAT N-terminal domain-containing protein [Haloarchaeobius amylolyticus]|uniref:acyl-CoA thioesterase/BAAT N-terminal domain-containing protein n=1 Tax=Haloarchaeobius amylolyticus TaxID=1198296 RepID=UPI00226FB974|nr:acyl-CoA thioester hydrolase/BAAT C-terminal domain-containing protein [Haloarchaeobius amylolyticus]
MVPSHATDRRRVLRALGGGALAGLAGCLSGSETADPTLRAPETVLADDPFGIRVEGLSPGATVTLRATSLFGGDRYGSFARFEADESGALDLREAAPVAGTYEGTDPMGLVWSLRPAADLPEGAPPGMAKTDTDDGPGLAEDELAVRAVVDDDQVAGTQVRRRVADPDLTTVTAPEGIVARCYLPPDDGPAPAVLVLHGGGRGRWMDRPAKQLASHGFAAVALRYVGPQAPIRSRPKRIPLGYVDRAIDWVTGLDGVADGPVGAMGWSLGGQLALLLGARRDDVGAVAAYCAMDHVTHFDRFGTSPWEVDGEPLPSLEIDWDDGEVRPVGDSKGYHTRPAFEAAFAAADEATLADVRIPVEQTDGPVVAVGGGADAVLPAADAARRIETTLTEHDHPHRVEALTYEDTGHATAIPYRPTTGRAVRGKRAFGGTPAGIARAEADSWPTVLSVLEDGLQD